MSAILVYEDSLKKGLAHVGSHLEGHQERLVGRLNHIRNNSGDPEACKRALQSHAETASLISWFQDKNLVACKQWAYVAAKLRRMIYQNAPLTGIYSPGVPFRDLLWPLLSGHSWLIKWYGAFNGIDVNRAKKSSTWEFLTFQAKLALRGEWEVLADRGERFLLNVPERMKRFASDNRFFVALARGDIRAMEDALSEMVKPDSIKWRNEDDGYTGWFIVREAVIYNKIAWLHGYQVDIGSPWIPSEWLPISPLPHYEDPYPFMQLFDIEMPMSE
jgi:hypothetical protein